MHDASLKSHAVIILKVSLVFCHTLHALLLLYYLVVCYDGANYMRCYLVRLGQSILTFQQKHSLPCFLLTQSDILINPEL